MSFPPPPKIFARASAVSTNDDAFALLERENLCLIWTLNQSGGRGSRGRDWLSPKGHGLAVSLGLEGAWCPSPAEFCFPIFAAIWLYESLRQCCGERGFILKWPNDLLLNGKKLAGILCESRWAGTRLRVVIGIGINLRNHEQFRALEKGSAHLGELATPPPPETIVTALAQRLPTLLQHYQNGRAMNEDWLARSQLKPGMILAVQAYGLRRRGTFVGLHEDGSMILRDKNGFKHTIRQSCEDFKILKSANEATIPEPDS